MTLLGRLIAIDAFVTFLRLWKETQDWSSATACCVLFTIRSFIAQEGFLSRGTLLPEQRTTPTLLGWLVTNDGFDAFLRSEGTQEERSSASLFGELFKIKAFVTFHRRKGAQDWSSAACVIFTIGAVVCLRSRNGTQERSSTTFTIENRPSTGGFSRGCVSVTIEGLLGLLHLAV
jgi:hypothetical protein